MILLLQTLLALSPAFASFDNVMPAGWEYAQKESTHLWRNQELGQAAILQEVRRQKTEAISARHVAAEKDNWIEQRTRLMQIMGFSQVTVESIEFHELNAAVVMTEIKWRFFSPGGIPQQAHERLYSRADRVRLISFTAPLKDFDNQKSQTILNLLKPNWFGRSTASADESDELAEGTVCCLTRSTAHSKSDPLALKLPVAIPICKNIAPEDLASSTEPGLNLSSLYNESKLSVPIGCAQGVYETAAALISGAASGLKALWNFTWDTKYREEVAAAIGYGASALWNDPMGVGQKLVNGVIAELAKSWKELSCLNRRAATRAVCEAAIGIIGSGEALKVLKLGLNTARKEIPEISKTLNKALSKHSAKETSTAVAATTSAKSEAQSALARTVQAADPKSLPIAPSLAGHIDEATRLGEINEELISDRLKMLNSKTTRDKAYDDLRRLDQVFSSVLKEDGDSLSKKVDRYLEKHVRDAEERKLMRSCLLRANKS